MLSIWTKSQTRKHCINSCIYCIIASLADSDFVVQVLGLVVGLSGVHLFVTYTHSRLFFSDPYITLSALLTLVSAAFLLVSGSFGSWLSLKDSTFTQGLVSSVFV